jgi:tRNA G10  N-methylase Trm11
MDLHLIMESVDARPRITVNTDFEKALMFKLLVADALTVMKRLGPQTIDAVICDPPYGTTQCAWDAVIPLDAMWSAIRRVRKPGAPIVFTCCQPFTSALVMSNPKEFRHEWVWVKNKVTGHLNAKRRPMRAHEDIVVFCDRAPVYTPQMVETDRPGNQARRKSNGACYGAGKSTDYGGSKLRYPRSVQEFAIVNNDDPSKFHPTQKPVELMEYLTLTYTKPGDLVLDFAMGSGSTGVACAKHGRHFVGCDTSPEYVERAKARFAAL